MQSSGVTLPAGQRVRHWREIKGVTQLDLAEKAGIGPARLCRIEKGKTEARSKEVEALAAALGLTMPEFYGDIAA